MGKSAKSNNPIKDWWATIAPNQQKTLVIVFFLVLVAIPLSVRAAMNEVSYTPRAYQLAAAETSSLNNPPQFVTSAYTGALRCDLNQACTAKFEATDPDVNDNLVMDINFLPPDLQQDTCQTTQNYLNRQTISCSFSGTPTKSGKFKLMVTVDDGAGNQTAKAFTLTIR